MSRIDFAFGTPDRLRTTCEVVRKHYLSGRRLLIYTQDSDTLAHIDRLLWSFEPTAFIPHAMADDPMAARAPIQLTSTPPTAGDGEPPWLINLDRACPPAVEQFERVLEIVSEYEDDKQAARERWLQYKAAGHSLHAHDLSGTPA